MTPEQLQKLSINLGKLTKAPERVYGGLLHVMWRVDTDEGVYAVKQLTSDVSDERVVKNYNFTEQVGRQFASHGIPAVVAIGELQVIDGAGFLVYPWAEAAALAGDAVSEKHALIIAALLAKMHSVNLQLPEIMEQEIDVHSDEEILESINKAEQLVFAKDLRKNQALLLDANESFYKALPILKKHSVVGHGDLDQKNVLWDAAGEPLLIDWESARVLNPSYEIINASLDWSGITTNFNHDLFIKMINAYKAAGGTVNDAQSSIAGATGNWIRWLLYNIERVCRAKDAETKRMGEEQVYLALGAIIRLRGLSVDL